jgi:hypothetical protein
VTTSALGGVHGLARFQGTVRIHDL